MVLLAALVPAYVFIPGLRAVQTWHVPELPLDRRIPVWPVWSLVYGAFYLYLILLPVLVIRDAAHIRRTLFAYIFVWVASYGVFLLYPTSAPRPAHVAGQGFAAWGLRVLYDADPAYNCFPSIHVAHSFVSALTCYRLRRGLGLAATGCASLVAVSTLFSKQHYVLDVVAGIALACLAYLVFLWRVPQPVPEADRGLAPAGAIATLGLVAGLVGALWVVYRVTGPAWAGAQ
jgi:membrane-associated phospholipid phosphatase